MRFRDVTRIESSPVKSHSRCASVAGFLLQLLALLTSFVKNSYQLGYIARHHEELEKDFTDEQKEIFEKFQDCWGEYMSLAEAAIFEYAFRLGAQLAMEIQSDTTE